MTAHMEKGPAIHGNDLKDLRSGISAIRRKLDSQKIIDEVNIERLGITVGKEVRRMERNFLSSSAAALLVAPILPFILHSFCGFSWWLCGTFGLLEALAAIDFYCKYRRLHKIDFAGTPVIRCGKELALYRQWVRRQQKRRLPFAAAICLWVLAETLFFIEEEFMTTVLAGIGIIAVALTVLVPQYKAQSRAIDNFCAQVEEFSRKEDEVPKQ